MSLTRRQAPAVFKICPVVAPSGWPIVPVGHKHMSVGIRKNDDVVPTHARRCKPCGPPQVEQDGTRPPLGNIGFQNLDHLCLTELIASAGPCFQAIGLFYCDHLGPGRSGSTRIGRMFGVNFIGNSVACKAGRSDLLIIQNGRTGRLSTAVVSRVGELQEVYPVCVCGFVIPRRVTCPRFRSS